MQFRIGIPTLLGSVLDCAGLWHLLKWVLDWTGRYDAGHGIPEKLAGVMMDFPWFYGALILVGVAFIWWDRHRRTKEISVTITPLLASVVLTACALSAWGWYLYDRSQGPVVWTWNEHCPITIGRTDDVYGVYSFGFSGLNRSDEPISKIKTFIKSNITGETMPLGFAAGQLVPAEKVIIPPGVQFFLHAVLPGGNNSAGIPFEHFRTDYGRFTFSFEYEGGSFVRTFNEAEVDRIIESGYRIQQEVAKRPALNFSGIRIQP
jgi:hypothetical protein